jgi:hypothetical protein
MTATVIGGLMWDKDWVDTFVVVSWISAWSLLVYLIPSGML